MNKIDMNEVQVFNKLSETMDYLVGYYQDMKGFNFITSDGYDYEGTVAIQMLHYDSETKLMSQLYLMTNDTVFLSEDISNGINRYYLRQSPITKTEYKNHLQEIEKNGIYIPNDNDSPLTY